MTIDQDKLIKLAKEAGATYSEFYYLWEFTDTTLQAFADLVLQEAGKGEPVAWMWKNIARKPSSGIVTEYGELPPMTIHKEACTPLYLHPSPDDIAALKAENERLTKELKDAYAILKFKSDCNQTYPPMDFVPGKE